MIKLDKIDREILNHLQENCRITVKELSDNLGLSPTPIFERIKKMENQGIIEKYVALINPKSIHKGLTIILNVSLTEHSLDALNEFLKHITILPEVMECFHVTGEFDFLIKLVTEDMESYNRFILEKLSIIPNLGKVNTQFALSTRKYTTAYNVEEHKED